MVGFVVGILGGSHIDTFCLKESRAVMRKKYGQVYAVPEVSIERDIAGELGLVWEYIRDYNKG